MLPDNLLNLSDSELSALMAAAEPLAPDRRDAFVREVASELARCPVIGSGSLHRIVAEVQRHHYNAPLLDGRLPGPGKHGRR